MASIPSFSPAQLEGLCKVLGDTGAGLTGSEITLILRQEGIPDPFPGETKWRRLFLALDSQQRGDCCGNRVISFIQTAMAPVRHLGKADVFTERLSRLNAVLAFSGLELSADGSFRTASKVRTLSEAQQRANRLREDLSARRVHPDVLGFCRPELLADNYFHAVLEATKSVADKIRKRTGLTCDGSELVDTALALGKVGIPFLAFNTLQTESERSEQSGLCALFKGMFGTFRNPTAHAPRVHWSLSEQDALDLLVLASFIHRRLDQAARTSRAV